MSLALPWAPVRGTSCPRSPLTCCSLQADFKLMCDNAMTYNRPDTVYYKLAKKILHAGFKMMSKVRACSSGPRARPHCGSLRVADARRVTPIHPPRPPPGPGGLCWAPSCAA